MDSPPNTLLSNTGILTMVAAVIGCYAAMLVCRTMQEVTIRLTGRRMMPTAILVQGSLAVCIWATHYLILESYRLDRTVTYDPWLSAASLAVLFAGLTASLLEQLRANHSRFPNLYRILASGTAVAGTVGMYYVSMAGYQVEQAVLIWSVTGIALAVSVPIIAALLTPVAHPFRKRSRNALSAALMASAICWLHFVDASTIRLVPVSGYMPDGIATTTVLQAVTLTVSALALAMTVTFSKFWNAQTRFMKSLQSALEALPLGLAIYDRNDRLLMWNNRFEGMNTSRITRLKRGLTYKDVLKSGLKDDLLPGAGSQSDEWVSAQALDHTEGDWLHLHSDNKTWYRIQRRRTYEGGLVSLTSDFTDQKDNERQLAQALAAAESASVAKSRFLANMSHEIRTPLNGVVAVSDALGRTKLSPTQKEMVELIASSSRNLQTLLSDILDLARVESGQMVLAPESFDLEKLVRETCLLHASAAHEKGVAFNVHVPPSMRLWVEADPLRTRQILGNLLSNAVKFTDEGHVTVNVEQEDGKIRFIIADTGIGFDPRLRERLFDRFEQADGKITRSYGGSGLGLSICTELANMMGGHLECTSVEGAGSIFTLSLPLVLGSPPSSQAPRERPAAKKRAKNKADAPLRILLADDNVTNRRVVQLIMASANVTITEAENGQQALDLYAEQPFDLILMDMQMPVMDGLTATRAIRKLEADKKKGRTALIMLTANALPEHVDASLAAGADAHLAKPFHVSQLLELAYNLVALTVSPPEETRAG